MYVAGDVIDNRYLVEGLCNDSGGMGVLLFVEDTQGMHAGRIVLKYCRETEDEQVKRFRREVRLLSEYKGNARVVQLLDFNVDHDPPFFVMRYYENGDLTRIIDEIAQRPEQQEKFF